MINIPNGGFPPIICVEKNIKKGLKKVNKEKGTINLVELLKKTDKKINVINIKNEDNILEEINEL